MEKWDAINVAIEPCEEDLRLLNARKLQRMAHVIIGNCTPHHRQAVGIRSLSQREVNPHKGFRCSLNKFHRFVVATVEDSEHFICRGIDSSIAVK
jgi:hypothetical protein